MLNISLKFITELFNKSIELASVHDFGATVNFIYLVICFGNFACNILHSLEVNGVYILILSIVSRIELIPTFVAASRICTSLIRLATSSGILENLSFHSD